MAFPVLCSGYDSRNAKKKVEASSVFAGILLKIKIPNNPTQIQANIKSCSCFAAIFWFDLLLHHVHRILSFSLLSFKSANNIVLKKTCPQRRSGGIYPARMSPLRTLTHPEYFNEIDKVS